MKIAELIKEALDKKGLKSFMTASKALGISPELLRLIVKKGHIPKDKTLTLIAKKLKIEMPVLVLAAHKEKVPFEANRYFLAPSELPLNRDKRKHPFSEAQTTYLAKILNDEEILMIRKLRQVTDEARIQIIGYVEFTYASRKSE